MPKCAHCKHPYTRTHNGIETWCSVDCGYKLARAKQAKAVKAEKKAFKAETVRRKKAILDKCPKHQKKKAKTDCHAYIRARDAGKGCKSCGTKASKQWDAGHFIPSGRGSYLRYDERNIFLQCCACNDGNKLSGNILAYRRALVAEFGEDYVQELERLGHIKKSWSIDELKEVQTYYKAKLKALR